METNLITDKKTPFLGVFYFWEILNVKGVLKGTRSLHPLQASYTEEVRGVLLLIEVS